VGAARTPAGKFERFRSRCLKLVNSYAHMNRWNRTVVTLCLGMAAAFLGAPPLPAHEPASPLDMARQLNLAFIELADKVSPSVVVVSVAHKSPHAGFEEGDDPLAPYYDQMPKEFRRWLEKRREQQKKEDDSEDESKKEPVFDGQGSGVVIRKDGYILTNRHVVDGADKIKVRFSDGAEFDGEIRGVDAQSDVAVVKIEPRGRQLVAARLGDSDKTRVGEFAIAIGAPFDLDCSVTFGHVSAKGRTGILRDRSADQDFIQTDANINPGNSGGPLLNIEGEVIGLNTLIRGMRTGIGFAIPINLAREVADHLIEEGRFVRAYLGVSIHALKDDPKRDVFTNIQSGVVINAIPLDGPAAKSNLKPGDVITAVEGKPVASPQQLRNEIRGKKVGSVVTLDVHRFGKNLKVKVRPEAWPDQTTPVIALKPALKPDKGNTLGLTVESITTELADQFGVEKTEGIIVTEVETGGVAAKNGLETGDIITEVNQQAVKSPKEFREALKKADLKKGVILNFTRHGTGRFEILKDSGD
jgi:serine protease Do